MLKVKEKKLIKLTFFFLKKFLRRQKIFFNFFFFFWGGKWTELSRGGMDLVIVRKNGLSY